MNDIIERILSLLNDSKMTAKELTESLNINKTSVSEWKSGKIKPSIEVVIRISKIFDVSLDWLLTGEGESQSTTEPSTLPELSETEEMLLNAYRSVNDKTKRKMLRNVLDLEDSIDEY